MGLVACSLIFVSGCNRATPAPASTQSSDTSPDAAAVEPVSPVPADSALTSPIANPPGLAVVPTPSSVDRSTVTGILILEGNVEQPVSEAILFLGSIVIANDAPALASLNKQAAPKAQTNAEGQFIFEDVPAGDYALLLDMIVSTYVLHSPTGEDMIIKVDGGQVVDLGELRYSDLPISNDSP